MGRQGCATRCSRCTSTPLVAASTPGARPAGGGRALRSVAEPGEVDRDSLDGTVLIRHPPMLMCTVVVSIQKLTLWSAGWCRAGTAAVRSSMFPDRGTTRSTSMAYGQLIGSARRVTPPVPRQVPSLTSCATHQPRLMCDSPLGFCCVQRPGYGGLGAAQVLEWWPCEPGRWRRSLMARRGGCPATDPCPQEGLFMSAPETCANCGRRCLRTSLPVPLLREVRGGRGSGATTRRGSLMPARWRHAGRLGPVR